MSAPRFTPGPWGIESETRSADGSDLIVTDGAGGYTLASCRVGSTGVANVEEAEANARLIAAAPDLYAAVCNLFDVADRNRAGFVVAQERWCAIRDHARAALAKAEGK